MNPMVALRDAVCSDRWDEAWALIAERLRSEPREPAESRRTQRPREKALLVQAAVPEAAITEPEESRTPAPATAEREPVPTQVEDRPVRRSQRPAPDHPWKRMAVGRAQRAA